MFHSNGHLLVTVKKTELLISILNLVGKVPTIFHRAITTILVSLVSTVKRSHLQAYVP